MWAAVLRAAVMRAAATNRDVYTAAAMRAATTTAVVSTAAAAAAATPVGTATSATTTAVFTLAFALSHLVALEYAQILLIDRRSSCKCFSLNFQMTLDCPRSISARAARAAPDGVSADSDWETARIEQSSWF